MSFKGRCWNRGRPSQIERNRNGGGKFFLNVGVGGISILIFITKELKQTKKNEQKKRRMQRRRKGLSQKGLKGELPKGSRACSVTKKRGAKSVGGEGNCFRKNGISLFSWLRKKKVADGAAC